MVVVVVVAGVVVGGSLGLRELLGGRRLGLRVQVLDLGLAEDAGAGSVHILCNCTAASLHPRVTGGRLVDIGLVDDEEDLVRMSASVPRYCCMCTHVLRSAEGDACDAVDVLQA
jgi:hypothetical protein